MTTNLMLDARQRAMLLEMGIRVWLPSEVAPVHAAALQTKQEIASQPAPTPVRQEPPIRLPVLSSPPAQAAGALVRYAISNMPSEVSDFDCVLLGEPCSDKAEKLLGSMLRALGGKVFVAQIVAGQNEGLSLIEQLQSIPAKAVLVLGPHAVKALLGEAAMTAPFGKLRGFLHNVEGLASKIAVTYHPLQLLRQPLAKAQTWLDLKIVMKAINQ